MTLAMIEARKAEIKDLVDSNAEGTDFEALEKEVNALEERKAFLLDEQRKADITAVLEGAGEEAREIIMPMEGKTMATLDEIRSSKAYIDAFAEYLKSEDDKECRTLLTDLVKDGQVPVPSFIESEIKTAWEKSDLLSRVKKSYVKGILKTTFELSATGAVVHTEGADAPNEEELTFGIVSLTPASIKKWIKISDECVDLKGEEFLRYIYDELVYQITKKIEELIVDTIDAAPTTSNATAIGVPVVEADPSATTIVEALAELSSSASNIAIVMNRKTYKNFKAIQYANNYAIDIFEGCAIIYNDKLPAFDDADAEDTYLMVGDFSAVQANFPEGEGVSIKYDDKSLAEYDLVKIVGREYMGLAITTPKYLVKVAKADAES